MFEPLVAHKLGLETGVDSLSSNTLQEYSLSHSFVGLELACSLKYGREMLPSWISIDVVGNQLHTGSSDKIGRWDIICHRHVMVRGKPHTYFTVTAIAVRFFPP